MTLRGNGLHYIRTEAIELPPGNVFKQPSDDWFRFIVCLQEKLQISINGKRKYSLKTGELTFLPAGCSYLLSAGMEVKAAILSFQAGGRVAEALKGLAHPVIFRLPQIRNWLPELQQINENSELAEHCRMQSHLFTIVSACLKAEKTEEEEKPELARFVLHIRRRMLEQFDLTLEMESLARSSGSSRFYRVFREHTGLSPHQFLTKARLQASLRLLADPGVSVTKAAHSVGYSDEFYFSRLFKKRMGIAPTEYAAKARTRAAVLCGVFAGDLEALGMTPCIRLKKNWDKDITGREGVLEQLRLANPEVILSGPIPEELRLALSAIAPVREYDWHRYSWKKRLAQFGELFGLSGIAEQWLSDFDSKSANARTLLRERCADTPFLLVGVRKGNFRVFGTQVKKLADLLYDEIGFQAPPAASRIGFMDAKTLCEVAKLECDHVLFLMEYPAWEEECRRLEEEWGMLKADGRPKHSFCIRLDEPFNYNATMHEMLLEQIVYHLHTENEVVQKSP